MNRRTFLKSLAAGVVAAVVPSSWLRGSGSRPPPGREAASEDPLMAAAREVVRGMVHNSHYRAGSLMNEMLVYEDLRVCVALLSPLVFAAEFNRCAVYRTAQQRFATLYPEAVRLGPPAA
jgi:hypothetical protein